MSLTHTISEKDDVITLNFDVNQLKELPLRVAMKTLEIIEKNNQMNGYFIEFDDKTQQFIEHNASQHITELNLETNSFRTISQFYFDSLSGPLYVYADRVQEVVSSIYEKEKYFQQIEEPKVPKITYKFSVNPENNLEKVLEVKNINDLISNFGKAVTLESLILFKDHVNYEYQIQNKTTQKPYGISTKVFSACFDEETNSHPHLKKLEGKDYILDSLFFEQAKKIKTPEEIFKLVLMKESLREAVELENQPKSIKKNKI